MMKKKLGFFYDIYLDYLFGRCNTHLILFLFMSKTQKIIVPFTFYFLQIQIKTGWLKTSGHFFSCNNF